MYKKIWKIYNKNNKDEDMYIFKEEITRESFILYFLKKKNLKRLPKNLIIC
jgi:hypothetical protein